MKTFTLYGDKYPHDSIYSKVMADYMITPLYSPSSQEEWALYRDFAINMNMSIEQMRIFMESKDLGAHNVILMGPPKSHNDLLLVSKRLGI